MTRVNCAKRGIWPEPEGQAHRIGFVLRAAGIHGGVFSSSRDNQVEERGHFLEPLYPWPSLTWQLQSLVCAWF